MDISARVCKKSAEYLSNLAVIFTEASRDFEPPQKGVVGAEGERRPDHERVAHVQRVRMHL